MGESGTGDINWHKALRQFQNVIATGTKSMKMKAMVTMTRFSKHAPEHVLARSIPFLIEILGRKGSNDSVTSLQKAAAFCLKCLACRGDELITQMGRDGAAQSLMSLLPNSDGKFLEILAKCLLVVLCFCNASRAAVATNGGVETIINLLNSCEDGDIRRYLLEILSLLALQKDVRKEIIRLDAHRFVVEAVGVGSMLFRERACHAIGMLGFTRDDRQTLVNLGVIPRIVDLFRDGDHAGRLIAGNTLGVISAYVDCMRSIALAGAISLYAELLQGCDPSGRDIAEDAFCVLAVVEANAVEIMGHLVRILIEGDDEAKAAASDVVWDLLSYHPSIPLVLDSGALPVLTELLGSGSDEVMENVAGAFAQLSYESVNRAALSDAGVISILIDLLHNNEFEDLRDNAAEALVNFYEDPLYHDSVSDVINVPSFRSMQNQLANDPFLNGGVFTGRIRGLDQMI